MNRLATLGGPCFFLRGTSQGADRGRARQRSAEGVLGCRRWQHLGRCTIPRHVQYRDDRACGLRDSVGGRPSTRGRLESNTTLDDQSGTLAAALGLRCGAEARSLTGRIRMDPQPKVRAAGPHTGVMITRNTIGQRNSVASNTLRVCRFPTVMVFKRFSGSTTQPAQHCHGLDNGVHRTVSYQLWESPWHFPL
jgi:hypothetical protein